MIIITKTICYVTQVVIIWHISMATDKTESAEKDSKSDTVERSKEKKSLVTGNLFNLLLLF